jgi:acyl-CoA thioester hydrolase
MDRQPLPPPPVPAPPRRAAFCHWLAIPSRWSDNDMLGHLNNVTYFRFFEAVVVDFVINQAGVRWIGAPVVPYAVEVLCRFRRALSFPATVDAGLAVSRIGTSSVTYQIGLFAQGDDDAAAFGHFVHVFVLRENETPIPIPESVAAVYRRFLIVPDRPSSEAAPGQARDRPPGGAIG